MAWRRRLTTWSATEPALAKWFPVPQLHFSPVFGIAWLSKADNGVHPSVGVGGSQKKWVEVMSRSGLKEMLFPDEFGHPTQVDENTCIAHVVHVQSWTNSTPAHGTRVAECRLRQLQ